MELEDRQIAQDVFARVGVKVSKNHVALWDDEQLAYALVWADSIMLERPIERPPFLSVDYSGSIIDTAAIIGRRIDRVEWPLPRTKDGAPVFDGVPVLGVVLSDKDVILRLDRGALKIALDGD